MDIRWHGLELDQPTGTTAARARSRSRSSGEDPLEPDLHVMMNMDDNPHAFAVPQDGKSWLVFADTGKASPDDIAEPGEERPFEGERCDVEGRSIVILVSQES